MIAGITKSGFKYELEEKRLNNYELMEVLSVVDENLLLLPKTVNLLLGPDQAERLKEHVRGDDGFVDSDVLALEIKEMFEAQLETKNSYSLPEQSEPMKAQSSAT